MLLNRRFVFLLLLFFSSLQLHAKSLPDFADLVEEHGKAVVNISTMHKVNPGYRSGYHQNAPWGGQVPEGSPLDEFFKRFIDEGSMPRQKQKVTSLGSGFIISENGYIITNHHVIEGADEVLVRLSDKRELSATIIGSDKLSDIALLKVEADDLPVVNIGSSDKLRVGNWVLAIGSPFGFDHSATAGIVSAKGRSLPSANYVPFIQTDVAINPGNSGGPLFNLDGEVIGINSQIYSRTGGFMGLSFAIPVEVAMNVVDQIKKSGTVSRGWLGVYIQEITHEIAESFKLDKPVGALVSQIIPQSPAEKAGLRPGDIILSFNDSSILDSSDLPPLVGQVPVGNEAEMKILRNGRNKTIQVKIEQLPSDNKPIAAAAKTPSTSSNRIGVEVVDLDDESRQTLGRGVLVRKVKPGSPANRSGLVAGDVLLQINRKNIKNVADFRKKVANLPIGRMIPVLVHRQGANQFIVMKISDRE